MFSGTLDSTGAFSGTFTVPAVPTGTTFLTAQDSSGDLTFNVLDVFPPTAILSSINDHVLYGNDDGSTGQVSLGFTANFFGYYDVSTVAEKDRKKVACPKCSSRKVSQQFGSFFAKTSRKS